MRAKIMDGAGQNHGVTFYVHTFWLHGGSEGIQLRVPFCKLYKVGRRECTLSSTHAGIQFRHARLHWRLHGVGNTSGAHINITRSRGHQSNTIHCHTFYGSQHATCTVGGSQLTSLDVSQVPQLEPGCVCRIPDSKHIGGSLHPASMWATHFK